MAFTDTFSDTDGTALDSHSPDTGTAWTNNGLDSGAFEISTAAGDELRRSTAGSTTDGYYACDDQGSADHEVIIIENAMGTAQRGFFQACRLVDKDNFIGMRLYGNGGLGMRLTKVVSGTATDLISVQGTAAEWRKMDVVGSTARLFLGGTGGTPSWTQSGTDQTYSENTTETTQGLVYNTAIGTVGSGTAVRLDYFEANSLGGSGTTVAVGLASETDSALSVTVVNPRSYAVGLVSETDSALALTVAKTVSVSLASETDSALTITPQIGGDITVPVGLASEINAALGITAINPRSYAVGQASETDTALSVSVFNGVVIGQAVETDSALAITPYKVVSVGVSSETDTALSLSVIGGAEAPNKYFGLTSMLTDRGLGMTSMIETMQSGVGTITSHGIGLTSTIDTNGVGVASGF